MAKFEHNHKVHVKVDDTVYVRTGKDRAHVGKVVRVIPQTDRVVVEGANIVHKHQKPRQQNQEGGIVEKENPISASNVMLVCPKCKRPTKVGRRVLENGSKTRYCKSCGEDIDEVRAAKK